MGHEILKDETLAAALADLPNWRENGGAIERRYRTSGWKATLMGANAVAHLAEAAWHHPDLMLSFSSLTVRLHTHDAGGITGKDIALARRIEALIGWNPAAEGFEGTPAAVGYIERD